MFIWNTRAGKNLKGPCVFSGYGSSRLTSLKQHLSFVQFFFPACVFQINIIPCDIRQLQSCCKVHFFTFTDVGYWLLLTSSLFAKLTCYANMETEPVNAQKLKLMKMIRKIGIFHKMLVYSFNKSSRGIGMHFGGYFSEFEGNWKSKWTAGPFSFCHRGHVQTERRAKIQC